MAEPPATVSEQETDRFAREQRGNPSPHPRAAEAVR